MTMRVRITLMLMVGLAIMGLASCDHYTCSAEFGASSCTPSGSGLGTTGPGNATAFVFVTDTSGTIDGYTLDQTAQTFAATTGYISPTGLPSGGLNASLGMVVANQKGATAPFLYALYPGGIYGFSVGGTGDLTPLIPVLFSSDLPAQIFFPEYEMIANPQGTLLFISDPEADTILVYSIATTGALTLAQTVSTSGIIEPQNLGMDGLGNYLYVTNYSSDHSGSFIAAYKVANTGALTLIATYAGDAPLWQVQGDPSGQYLIGVSGSSSSIPPGADNDSVYVYSINQTTGALTEVLPLFGTVPAYSPFTMAVQPVAGTTGPFIYTFSLNALGLPNPIEGFQLTPGTGALAALSGNPFTGAGTAASGGFDETGAYLFIYQEQSITAYQVSATGGLTTQFGFSAGLNTGGYWAVAEP